MRMKMTKQATDQYHWDLERLMQRAALVLDSWKGAAHIDAERLETADLHFQEGFRCLLMAIEDA